MSELTYSRKTLRRLVATELQMPFFRRFAAQELAADTTSTVSKIVDATLSQIDGFWNGHWFYSVGDTAFTGGDVSVIRAYDAANHAFQLEVPTATAMNTGQMYEIHSMWNAIEIHRAINRAILLAGRVFPDTVRDTTLIVQEDKLSYSLSSLAKPVFMINKLWVENPGTIVTGTATAGAAATITVQSVPTDIDTNWKISIYNGTGAGQIKDYVSNVGNVITVSAWTTQPDSTSKYAMWDASEELYDWIPMSFHYADSKEFPDTINLRSVSSNYWGLRLRLEYLSLPAELTTDDSTTIVPPEYIIPKACSILHGQKLNDTKSDRELHFAEHDRYGKEADNYLGRFSQHNPDNTLLQSDEYPIWNNSDDPLGWNSGG